MYDMQNLAKLKDLRELAPEAFKTFAAFDEAAFKSGVIPLKYKELIAVGVALTTQCPYCIEIHSKAPEKPVPPTRSSPKPPSSPPPSAPAARHPRHSHTR